MKRVGILVIVLVLALGAIGVGYAAWTDVIYIDGTVNTGNVDLNVVNYSGTWIYKVIGNENYPDEVWVYHGWATVPFEPPAGSVEPPVAYAVALPGGEDDTVDVIFENAFPLDELSADILLHYEGTIPVKVDAVITSVTGDAEEIALLAEVAEFHFYESDETGTVGTEITEGGAQLHYCDYVLCVMTLDIPQEDRYMNLSGSFTAEIRAVQWNEYPYTWPTPTGSTDL